MCKIIHDTVDERFVTRKWSIARNNTNIVNYADDRTVIGYCKNWNIMKVHLQEELDKLMEWFDGLKNCQEYILPRKKNQSNSNAK